MFIDKDCFEYQISGIDFGHKDRATRFKTVLETMARSQISLGFPQIFKDQYQLKGFYRLINNDFVSHSTFIDGYQRGLIEYSKAQISDKSRWILIQDSMLTDYNSRQLDLGYTQTIHSNGLILHHGLLLNADFVPLGLLHQEVIHRERESFGKSENTKNRVIEEKESNKWLKGIQTGSSFSQKSGRELIHIMDREADIVDLINLAQSEEQYFVIRARHDRSTLTNAERFKEENTQIHRLFHLMRNVEEKKLIRRVLKDIKGKDYEAVCELNFQSLKFRAIKSTVQCVWIREHQPADEKNPVEWFLLTNLPVKTVTDAEKIIELYSKRWTIEDYHKCYKTGCSVEKRQFDSRKTLTTVIGLLALLAVELLRSRYLAVNNKDATFDSLGKTEEEIELAKKLAIKYLKPIDFTVCKEFSVLWWVLLLGRMGGHQGFKQKGLPGWQSIWLGYQFYLNTLEGYTLYRNSS
jgi:hypothetical protein